MHGSKSGEGRTTILVYGDRCAEARLRVLEATLCKMQPADSGVRAGQRGIENQGLPECLHRRIRTMHVLESETMIQMGAGEVRPDTDSLFVLFDGLAEPTGVTQHDAEIVTRKRQGRVECDGLFQNPDGVADSALTMEDGSQAGKKIRAAGMGVDLLCEKGDGVFAQV